MNTENISNEAKGNAVLHGVSGSFPSDNEIETAALNYRDKSDDDNTNEDTMEIEVHWYDKQEAFMAGVKWVIENYPLTS
ncbi:MAG: hypothetical protein PWQ06_2744 [Anaerophaga sp.]|nr:hypothetical protein [Anaerophaga sp.]